MIKHPSSVVVGLCANGSKHIMRKPKRASDVRHNHSKSKIYSLLPFKTIVII
jgi:hypothetical protein